MVIAFYVQHANSDTHKSCTTHPQLVEIRSPQLLPTSTDPQSVGQPVELDISSGQIEQALSSPNSEIAELTPEMLYEQYQLQGSEMYPYDVGGDGDCGPYVVAAKIRALMPHMEPPDHVAIRNKIASHRNLDPEGGRFWVDEDWTAVAEVFNFVVVVFQFPRKSALSVRVFGDQDRIQSKPVLYVLNSEWTVEHPVEHYQLMFGAIEPELCNQYGWKLEKNQTIRERIVEHEEYRHSPILCGQLVCFSARNTESNGYTFVMGKAELVDLSRKLCMVSIIATRDEEAEVNLQDFIIILWT